MNEEEKANRKYRLYEFLRRASLDDSIQKRSKAAISQVRSRLYRKLHGTPGTGQMLDAFNKEAPKSIKDAKNVMSNLFVSYFSYLCIISNPDDYPLVAR